MTKKKLVVNYDNLPPGVLEEIQKQYPEGWAHHVIRVQGTKDTFFYAILIDLADVSYLVKVKVKKDRKGLDDEDLIPDFEELSEPDAAVNGSDETMNDSPED